MDSISSNPQLNNGIFILQEERSCAPLQQSHQTATTTDQTANHPATTPYNSKDKDKAPPAANPITASGNDEGEIVNPSRPTGVRFAILFTSILAGDFFVGYVCVPTSDNGFHLSLRPS